MIVLALLAVQAGQIALVVHRESLTFDEDDHIFAGYMMWKTGDYGLNPEHPPLVKLLATLPLLGQSLWTPPLRGRDFKAEAYLDGRDFLARNDGPSQHLLFRMRLTAGLLALALSVVAFLAAQEMFGTGAGLIALLLVTFDPNILAHSALVTTDIGVTLFFLASIYTFYRFVKQPSLSRLMLCGVAAGLLLATKHSGILLAPMILLLIGWEVVFAAKGSRARLALHLSGAFTAIVVVAVVVLWSFYGFRYAARPDGLQLSTSLADYAKELSHFDSSAVLAIAHLHLLPESYLMGLVDVKREAEAYPTFVLGQVYAHGQWWYFPAVIVIKTTLGMMVLVTLAGLAIAADPMRKGREVAFLLLSWIAYLTVAMVSGMNIGARHILPLYAMGAILAAGGMAVLASTRRPWSRAAFIAGVVLLLAHVTSSLTAFPNYMAYANEAWGGPKDVHKYLSDANVDWAQQLLQVKAWQDRHPSEECWFAYFAYPEVDQRNYGIRCHAMPTPDTYWLGGSEIIPPEIRGTVLISAGDLSGCEWPSNRMNPYAGFATIKPDELIDDGVMVYRGTFEVKQAAALSRAQNALTLLQSGKKLEALALAREAVAIDPEEVISESVLGYAAAAIGDKDSAREPGKLQLPRQSR